MNCIVSTMEFFSLILLYDELISFCLNYLCKAIFISIKRIIFDQYLGGILFLKGHNKAIWWTQFVKLNPIEGLMLLKKMVSYCVLDDVRHDITLCDMILYDIDTVGLFIFYDGYLMILI